MRIEINNYIVSDPEICGGTPTFKGTRVMVWQVLELLGVGVSIEEIMKDYFPHLSRESILSVFHFTSKLISEEYAR
ncbi:MAG: DUF433 domain-containing protein [Nanoarchaeota archaeon]